MAEIEEENVALRQQLNGHPADGTKDSPKARDRTLFALLYRLFPSVLDAIANRQTGHVCALASRRFPRAVRWKSRHRGGRARIEFDLRTLIRRMCRENPLWGAPRINGERLKLGFDVSQATISRYIAMLPRNRGQTWKRFLRSHADGMASIDLLVVPTIRFERLFAFVVLSHECLSSCPPKVPGAAFTNG